MSEFNVKPERALSVLHVDDDPVNLRVVEEILTAFGHRAVKAISGPEALEQLSAQAFDVVLMDIHMPEMSGIEVMKRIRERTGAERDVPIIALTADILSREPAEYLALGFSGFVPKPVMVQGLIAAVTRAAGVTQPALRLRRAG
ncbi:MAG TPA: response regulator [Phenylobacterium sp.]|nr:response regulator [Phenylobacterium sp.]